MIVFRTKTILYSVAIALMASVVVACGGKGTFSPTIGTSTPPVITVTITPAAPSTYPGGQIQFSAVVTGTTNKAVNWSVLTQGGGTISDSGLYQAPAENDGIRPKLASSTTRAPATTVKPFVSSQYTIQAVSQADPTKIATVSVTVADVSVVVSPANPTIVEGQSLTFTATVTGATNQSVLWFGNDGGGTIDRNTGVFTAGTVPGHFQVLAQSVAESGIQGFTDLTVVPPQGLTVTVTPSTATTTWIEGNPIQFSATVNGSSNQAVTWTVVPGTGGEVFGNISSSGLFSIPGTTENYLPTVTIKATSTADPTVSGTAVVTVENNS